MRTFFKDARGNIIESIILVPLVHDDVIKWKHFPRYWPFVRGIHRFPVNSPHKGQWGGALMFSLICAWTNRWVNNREAGDLRRHQARYDVSVMKILKLPPCHYRVGHGTFRTECVMELGRHKLHCHIYRWSINRWTCFFKTNCMSLLCSHIYM